MSDGRFTAYLPRERDLLTARAREEGSSENYLVRLGVRAILGLPIPPRYRDELRESLDAAAARHEPAAA